MSNQWNSGQFQTGLPSQGNQVRLFDPTQFQAPAAHGRSPSSKPRIHARQLGGAEPVSQHGAAPVSQHGAAPVSQYGAAPVSHAPPPEAAQSSWSSWNTWDQHSGVGSTQGDGQQQQQSQQTQQQSQQTQQQSQQTQQQSQQTQQHSQQTQQHNISSGSGGTQYYSENQYAITQNQGWDGFSQYSHPNQAYAPPGTDVTYQGQDLHQQQWLPPQQDTGTYGLGQYEGSMYDQQHYANNPASQQQQQSLQNQQTYGQQEAGDQGQVYQQDHKQYQGHTDAAYGNPYGGSTWTTPEGSAQWGSGNPSQFTHTPDAGVDAVSDQQLYTLQNPTSQGLPSPSNTPYSNNSMALTGPNLEVSSADDDDGTVSGFFGKDDDGDTCLDSQRHGFNYSVDNQGNSSYSPLAEVHRTSSEVTGASLSTFSASSIGADAGNMYSHTAKDVLVTQREQDKQKTSSQLAGGTSLGEQYEVDASVHHIQATSAEFIQRQTRGELSSTFHSPQSLPLNTDIRPASPDGDHPGSSGSGGSGTSGGSSGLTDWEIVPPQSGSLTPGHSSSLGNTSNVVLDKQDGSVSMSHSYENIEHRVQQPQGPQSQNYYNATSVPAASSNSQSWDSLQHSSVYDTPTTVARKSAQLSHETGGHLGGPSVGASGQQMGDNLLHPSQPVVQVPSATLVSGSANVPLPSVPQPGGASNPFRRDGGRSPRHTGIPQSVHSQNPNNAMLGSRGATEPAEYRTTAVNQNLGPQKSAITTTPTSAKIKLLPSSSSEDGNCISKRDSDHTVNTASNASTKNTSFNAEDSPVVSQQQQHHSAFHPVARHQQTVSPPAPAGDSSDKPTPNILLAPVVPLIIPALNPYSVSAAQTGANSTVTTSTATKVSGQEQTEPEQQTKKTQSRINDKKEERSREQREKMKQPREEEEEENRSFDSLDEIDSVAARHAKIYSNEQRENKDSSRVQKYERRGDPDRRSPDKHSSRTNPLSSQHDRDDRYHYDQPASRTDRHSKEEDYRRHHDYYRDYKDGSLDERYDRPRSRQDESFGSRPSSRSGQEAAGQRSRVDYDLDRGYYDKDRHRGYGQDSYSRNLDYYNKEREHYYRYAKDKEARLARAYYDEYYGAKYEEYYKQLEQHQRQQQLLQQQQIQGGRLSSQEFDRSSSHSQSRGSTPAIGPSPGPDQYGSHGSRPSSRTDYSRDYYSKRYAYEGYNPYYDAYGYDPYAYHYGYQEYGEYNPAYGQGRTTPPKHSYSHVRASFGPSGQLVKVLPNRPKDGQPALVEVQNIQTILESCPEVEELQMFPGPLARNTTHKNDVLLFCQKKARACAENIDIVDRESAQLIWKFLELLIKQNGSAVGTDLSDLLLEGHEPSTHEYSLHGVRQSQSPQSLDTVPEGNSEDGSSARESPSVRVTSDRTVISSADGEKGNWVDRFRHLLLYGRKKDALEFAMKNNLWGHALFLANKMDARTHANVMTRFANSAMRMNDPLQTLYQLMSGRQPAAVTCALDERWGDWRPHLAMILSNQSSKSDIHRKSISTLGDTLAAKGYLYASHFCYLMAQVNFGNYFNKTSKLVLIGSSHNLSLEEFATNEAIQCTEVYEYAQALGNPTYCLPHLQIYKYLYACRLADYGMVLEALGYCEVIAQNIQQNPACFQAPFVKLVCQLSRKLQFADPHLQMSGDGLEGQVWIQQLEAVCAALESGSIQLLPGAVTQAGLSCPTANSEIGEYSPSGYGGSGDTVPGAGVSSGVSAGVVSGQQVQGLAVSLTGQDVNVTGHLQNPTLADQSPQQMQGQLQGYSQQEGYYQHQQGYNQHLQGYSQQGYNQQEYSQQEYNQQNSSQLQQPNEYSLQQQYDYTHWQQQQEQYGSQTDHSSSYGPQASQTSGSHEAEQHQLPPRASISTNELSEDEDDTDDADGVLGGSAAGFDYFGNVGGQKVVAPPHRYRTTSDSSTGSIQRRRTMSGSSSGSVKAAPHKPPTQHQTAAGKGEKPGQPDNAGGGWFGGLFNKLKPKGKNEMILPDDKNPAIVWDPAKKKWMNADGTEEVAAPQAPPPKDTDLSGKSSATVPAPLGPGSLATSNSTGSNKFSLRATGARNQYVDISNTKPASLPQNVFNAAPETSSTVASSSASTGPPQMYNQGSSNVSTGAPQMYPAISGHTDARNVDSGHREQSSGFNVPSYSTGVTHSSSTATAISSQPSSSMPVLFNPLALKSGTSPSSALPTSTAPAGLKYGSRRAYPK
ncbi:hypothetical protein BsWGS_23637 [Bradybaena similaris]